MFYVDSSSSCSNVFIVDAASAGLVFSLIFSADNIFSCGMQQTAELGNKLVSVERMVEYTRLPPERKEIQRIVNVYA